MPLYCCSKLKLSHKKRKEDIIKVRSNNSSEAKDVLNQRKDSITKIKTILDNTTNKGIDENTNIIIDGKKATREEMNNTNQDDISTMNVSKTNNKSTITIITKKNSLSPESKVWINNKLSEVPDEDKVLVFGQNRDATQLELEKTDPTNLNGLQKPKTTRTVTVVKREKDGLTFNTDIYIDGVKSTTKELDLLDPNLISKMDVNNNDSNKKTVTIITKNNNQSSNNNLDITKQPNINDSNEKPILIINGKKANPEVNVDDIDPKTITSVNVLKGKTAIKKYGKKALNGVIEITTK